MGPVVGTETILFGFKLANSKESWQERETFMLHIAASETKIFRSSISSQDMQVLFVSPLWTRDGLKVLCW